jgi:hypothetical protein
MGTNPEEESIISRSRITNNEMRFSLREYEALGALRQTFQAGDDLFTSHELARLRFLRWLIRSPWWDTTMDQLPTTAQQASARKRLPWICGLLG